MSGTYRADTVIVGAGLAGLVTTLELLDAGQSVILLDRGTRDGIGGLARWSFGGIFVVGTPEQRRSRIRDSEALALQDWLATGELGEDDEWPRRWAEAYVNGCRTEVYEWLKERGVRFLPIVQWAERGLYRPGNSVPRFHMVQGTGERMIDLLRARLEAHPRRESALMLFGHRVTELLEEGGRVVGCAGEVERHGEGGINVRSGAFEARGEATVIASGGVAGNLEAVRRLWDRGWCQPPEVLLNGSHPEADGALHEVAERHGLAVTHLEKMWLYPNGVRHWQPRHDDHGLWLIPPKSALTVDRHGRRLGRPPLVGGFDTRHAVKTVCDAGGMSWMVLNQRIAQRELAVSGPEFNEVFRDGSMKRILLSLLFGNKELVATFVDSCPDFVTADSLADLAQRMNELQGNMDIDAGTLAQTVNGYDAMIGRGRAYRTDDQLRRIAQARAYRADWLRTCRLARIDDPRARPLIAIRQHVLARKSLGGIRTDLASRVMGTDGRARAGLYAVGEAAGFGGGGMHGKRSLEGTFLGGCILTARVAARAILGG